MDKAAADRPQAIGGNDPASACAPGPPAVVRVAEAIDTVDRDAWDRCAGPGNPFTRHAFLESLELSGSVSAETGWLPHHLLLEDGQGRLIGAVPLYLKGHSMGEYVFDHGWADAYHRAGGEYYPKLQSSIPFTPATGPRLLLHPDLAGADKARQAMIGALENVCERYGVSSVHVTFPPEADWDALGTAGWLQRTGTQYHWFNAGYTCFDDFLSELASRKRKQIKKERRQAAESDVSLSVLSGEDLRPEHWDAFYRFYQDTGSRKWGMPYLTRDFFDRIHQTMARDIALVMGRHDGDWVCGALNFIGADALYGRNWGCVGYWKFLHFEACYYQAIDFAITAKLSRVEAGAQGEHKLARGYVPVKTYSAHYIRDPALRAAIEAFLDREGRAVEREIELLQDYTPFRSNRTGDDP